MGVLPVDAHDPAGAPRGLPTGAPVAVSRKRVGTLLLLLVAALAAVLVGLPLMLIAASPSGENPPDGDALNAARVPAPFRSWVKKAGGVCPRISAPLIAAQIDAESGWDPTAISPAGAAGLSQFMPATWAGIGRDDDGNGQISTSDPGDAIMAQARYMCQLYQQVQPAVARGTLHGDPLDLTLASYNAGLGAVLQAGGMPPFPETQTYVPQILKATRSYALAELNPLAPGTSGGRRIIRAAQTQMGVPYIFAGGNISGPSAGTDPGVGYDCSGLVQYAVYQASGGTIELPHLARAQAQAGAPVPATLAAMRPGDLVFFALGDRLGAGTISHVGIYLGNGQLLNAGGHFPTGSVRVNDITTSYWTSKPWTVRRLNLGA